MSLPYHLTAQSPIPRGVAPTTMITSLLYEARIWPSVWRRRLADYWFLGDKGDLAFFGLLGLLILGLLGIIYFAYFDGTRIAPARIEALQREATHAQQRESDLQCLAENIYFEARGEPLAGQYAVAEVTLNRTHSRNFPHTICQVVHETRWDPNRRRFVADFSWTELREALSPEDGPAWRQAMAVASATYDDLHAPLVPDALFYHATNVRPGWSRTRKVVATIGNHIFYR
ncbi:MAG TPA: cell wall hydrolase [Steroidobacteraceae bacterium]|nr:cell wall hydrolase [Steroidobacteraceae bacterium]